jgi:hypothetical protein
MRELSDAQVLRQLAQLGDVGFIGTVQARDEATYTCTVAPLDAPEALIPNVSYVAFSEGVTPKVIARPKVGTKVRGIFLDLDQQQGHIFQAEEIDQLLIDCPEVVFAQGTFGGVPKVGPLHDAIERLETKFNDLLTILQSHTHSPAGGPPAGALVTFLPITPATTQAAIENAQLKH